ncbi:hypothetical protein I311_04248 [Cryptococcus gattii NT-10]|nr:hypothetical protein I311_04248 [Cryptococcus gattii NT-10]
MSWPHRFILTDEIIGAQVNLTNHILPSKINKRKTTKQCKVTMKRMNLLRKNSPRKSERS